jgi:hypothetical protein
MEHGNEQLDVDLALAEELHAWSPAYVFRGRFFVDTARRRLKRSGSSTQIHEEIP